MSGVNYDAAMSGLSGRWNSGKKLSNGKEYSIASYIDSEGDMFTLTIELLDDNTSNAIIMRSPKTVMYEYDLEGATRGSSIPYALRQRIASDFEGVSADFQQIEEPTEEENLEQIFGETTTVVEESFSLTMVYGEVVRVDMTSTTTTGGGNDGSITYQVSVYVDDVYRMNTGFALTQEQAEIDYQTQIDFFTNQNAALQPADAGNDTGVSTGGDDGTGGATAKDCATENRESGAKSGDCGDCLSGFTANATGVCVADVADDETETETNWLIYGVIGVALIGGILFLK